MLTCDWLPERHLSVAATLSHADELIEQISDLLFEYQTQTEDVFGLREVPAGPVSRTVVDRVAPIPRKVPLLVADALVALRASLEHALFAEAEFVEGTPLDEKAARLVEMPASDAYEKFEDWRKRRDKNGPMSLRTGSELLRRSGLIASCAGSLRPSRRCPRVRRAAAAVDDRLGSASRVALHSRNSVQGIVPTRPDLVRLGFRELAA